MSEREEKQMDKKNTASRQLAQTLPRFSNENAGSGGNKGPGSFQKRDFSYSSYSSNDLAQSKKFAQPRERGYDKRPLPKGPFNGGPRGGRNSINTKESMSMVVESPKAGCRPRKERERTYPSYSYLCRGTKARYKKEQFLQANCQFVVRENGDYTLHASNPDTLVDWDLIEQVRIFDHEVPSCPICLYPPKAAKMTRCGHCYCWPCMLHYLSLFDENYVNCPICYATVHEKDLKSVVALQTARFTVGQEITMKLMKKSRGQTFVSPRSIWSVDCRSPFGVTDKGNNSYAKILTADNDYIQQILETERGELLLLMFEEEHPDTLEGSFITAALKSLERRSSRDEGLAARQELEMCLQAVKETLEADVGETPADPGRANHINPSRRYTCAFSDKEDDGSDEPQLSPTLMDDQMKEETDDDRAAANGLPSTEEGGLDLMAAAAAAAAAAGGASVMNGSSAEGIVMTASGKGSPEPKKYCHSVKDRKPISDAFYFYQSADGQHIYLHGLNINCLKAHYGDLSNCPDELTGRIVDLEHVFMDEEHRRRYRCLNHLPLTCEFMMAELELKPPIVSEEVLNQFADEIEKRCQVREKKKKVPTATLR